MGRLRERNMRETDIRSEGKEYEKAVAYIRELIALHKIEIGSKLPSERELSATLSISRNSIREALRMLENVGVIESQQGCGNFLCGNVTRSLSTAFDMLLLLRETDTEDICRFRRSIEKAGYDLAWQKRADNPYLTQMRQVLDAFPNAAPKKRVELDKEFHYLLIQAADNQLFKIIMDALSDIYQEWIGSVLTQMPPEGIRQLHRAHTAIYESLLTGNRMRGLRAIDEHYDIVDRIHLVPDGETASRG